MAEQAGLCLTWSETPKTGFLVTRLNLFTIWCHSNSVEQHHVIKIIWPQSKPVARISRISMALLQQNIQYQPYCWQQILKRCRKLTTSRWRHQLSFQCLHSGIHSPVKEIRDLFIMHLVILQMSRSTKKPTKWPVRPAKTQISLGIHPVWSES